MVLLGAICEGQRVPAVTIFGWDDVLCPTTHAKVERNKRTSQSFGVPMAQSKDNRKELLRVGASVVRCVQAAQRHGPVVIVTESDENWVRGTAELLLPGSASACLKNVEVVSSRSRFGKDFPGQPACWQIAAFSYVTNRHLLSPSAAEGFREDARGADTNGGRGKGGQDSRGDRRATRLTEADGGADCTERGEHGGGGGAIERNGGTLVAVSTASRAWGDKSATRTLREHHPRVVAKTVSLMKGPTPCELRKQLDLLSENFEWMFGHPRDGRSAAGGNNNNNTNGGRSGGSSSSSSGVERPCGADTSADLRTSSPLRLSSGSDNGEGGVGSRAEFDEEDYKTSSTDRSVDDDMFAASPGGSVDGDKGGTEAGPEDEAEDEKASRAVAGRGNGRGDDEIGVRRAGKAVRSAPVAAVGQ